MLIDCSSAAESAQACIFAAMRSLSGCIWALKRGAAPAFVVIALSTFAAATACPAQERNARAPFEGAIGTSVGEDASKLELTHKGGNDDAMLWSWLRAGTKAPNSGTRPVPGLVKALMPGKKLGALVPGGGEQARAYRRSAPASWRGYAMAAILAALAALLIGRCKTVFRRNWAASDQRWGTSALFGGVATSDRVPQASTAMCVSAVSGG